MATAREAALMAENSELRKEQLETQRAVTQMIAASAAHLNESVACVRQIAGLVADLRAQIAMPLAAAQAAARQEVHQMPVAGDEDLLRDQGV